MLLFLIVEEIVHDMEITEKKKTKEKEIAHNSTKAMYFCSTFWGIPFPPVFLLCLLPTT